MKIIVLGGSGMLGQALIPEGQGRGHVIIAPTHREVDITDDNKLEEFIREVKPDLLINAAALINFNECQENPRTAYIVNGRPVAIMANMCRDLKIDFVQISSDQCAFPLLNEYAMSKAAGEYFAQSYDRALVVRTNIVGPKNMAWAFKAIENDEACTLYTNYKTNSIDVWSFSKALFDILVEPTYGIVNIASHKSFTKADFILSLAEKMGKSLTKATLGQINGRYSDLTLDISEAEEWLGYRLPVMCDTIDTLILEWRKNHANRKTLVGVG